MSADASDPDPTPPRWTGWLLAGLLALTVPWYYPAGALGPFVLGMPTWALASLVASVVFAAVSAWVILRHWRDDDGGNAPRGGGGR